MKIYLLLPAKDEAKNLSSLLEEAQATGLQPVVCDDGSGDETATVAERSGAIVLRHPINQGLAAAMRTLFDWFLEHGQPGDYAATMDADGTMSPSLVPAMVETAHKEGAEMVIASRYRGGGVKGLSPLRQTMSLGARALFSLFTPIPGVTDYTSGFRLYSYTFLKEYRQRNPGYFEAQGFQAQTELLLRAHSMKPIIREVGCTIHYDRKQGASKMRLVRTLWAYLKLLYRYSPPLTLAEQERLAKR